MRKLLLGTMMAALFMSGITEGLKKKTNTLGNAIKEDKNTQEDVLLANDVMPQNYNTGLNSIRKYLTGQVNIIRNKETNRSVLNFKDLLTRLTKFIVKVQSLGEQSTKKPGRVRALLKKSVTIDSVISTLQKPQNEIIQALNTFISDKEEQVNAFMQSTHGKTNITTITEDLISIRNDLDNLYKATPVKSKFLIDSFRKAFRDFVIKWKVKAKNFRGYVAKEAKGSQADWDKLTAAENARKQVIAVYKEDGSFEQYMHASQAANDPTLSKVQKNGRIAYRRIPGARPQAYWDTVRGSAKQKVNVYDENGKFLRTTSALQAANDPTLSQVQINNQIAYRKIPAAPAQPVAVYNEDGSFSGYMNASQAANDPTLSKVQKNGQIAYRRIPAAPAQPVAVYNADGSFYGYMNASQAVTDPTLSLAKINGRTVYQKKSSIPADDSLRGHSNSNLRRSQSTGNIQNAQQSNGNLRRTQSTGNIQNAQQSNGTRPAFLDDIKNRKFNLKSNNLRRTQSTGNIPSAQPSNGNLRRSQSDPLISKELLQQRRAAMGYED